MEVTSKNLQNWVQGWLKEYDTSAARHGQPCTRSSIPWKDTSARRETSRPKGIRKSKLGRSFPASHGSSFAAP